MSKLTRREAMKVLGTSAVTVCRRGGVPGEVSQDAEGLLTRI